MDVAAVLGWSIAVMLPPACVVGMVFGTSFPHHGYSRGTAVRAQIHAFRKALEYHRKDCGEYPAESMGLQAVRPYLDQDIPLDPWGIPYRYLNEPGGRPEVVSIGLKLHPLASSPPPRWLEPARICVFWISALVLVLYPLLPRILPQPGCDRR